jgi:hypothetical protein
VLSKIVVVHSARAFAMLRDVEKSGGVGGEFTLNFEIFTCHSERNPNNSSEEELN